MLELAPFVMVVLIVAIISVAKVMRAGIAHGASVPADAAEAERLRGEVRALTDRIQVLEAIVTDGDRNRSIALEREIEALRDRRAEARP